MPAPVLSLAEINDIERAYALGVPALGRAAAALVARWRLPLRDEETFLRLAFLSWYGENEPGNLTGLESELPDVAELIEGFAGETALGAEARFTLGFLLGSQPPLGGDAEASRRQARAWVEQAAEMDPESLLFREWRYFIGEAEHSLGARTLVEREIHARYAGRGALGDYMTHMLRTRLRPDGQQGATI